MKPLNFSSKRGSMKGLTKESKLNWIDVCPCRTLTNRCRSSYKKNDADLNNVELVVERRRGGRSRRDQVVMADLSLPALVFQSLRLLARAPSRAGWLALSGGQEREGGGVDGSVERGQSEGNILEYREIFIHFNDQKYK